MTTTIKSTKNGQSIPRLEWKLQKCKKLTQAFPTKISREQKMKPMTPVSILFNFCLLLSTLPAIAQVDANYCGSLVNGFGPFDYRPERDTGNHGDGDHKYKLKLVEGAHFTREVELLIRGHRSGSDPGGDIDYTLRAFPNHHPALMAVIRYGEKKASKRPAGLKYDVECYLERAVRFAADDAIARIIYATYFDKQKRSPEAISQLEQATRIARDNAFTNYNIGLAYLGMKVYDKALIQAHRALALGFERTQLRDLLEKAGHWKDPAIEPAATTANSPPATPSFPATSSPVADQ